MSKEQKTTRNRIRIPVVVAFLASIVALVSFFLPYLSSTKDYAEYLDTRGNEKAFETVDMTYSDMKDISLFEYAKVYFQGAEEVMRDKSSGTFYGVLMSLVGGLAFFIMLAVLKKKPILTFILNALLGGVCYLINWDFVDRGIMPNSRSDWGIAYYILYACVAVIAVNAVWMFIGKRRMKKETLASTEQ